jgi:hypothetical protein
MTIRDVQFAPDGNQALIGALDAAPADKELTRESAGIGKELKIQSEVCDPIGSLFNVNSEIPVALVAARAP